jgi:predicted TIM-barrel fold metal-dependent hydrolase
MTATKQLEGRDEPILEPDLPIVDSHHHLFERPGWRYLHEDYLDDAKAGHKIVASIYMEIQAMARIDGPDFLRPLGEVEFANGVGAIGASGQYGPCRVAAGIIGHADLRIGERVGELLDRCISAAPDRYRGIRQVTIEHPTEIPFRYITNRPPVGAMRDPGFHAGFAELVRRGLTFDAAVFDHQIPEVTRLAESFPDATIVLNHCGSVMAMGLSKAERAQAFSNWRESIHALARHQNVLMKIGGFGLPFWDFGFMERQDPVGYLELAAVWQPYVETSIEAFGAERCMMESNFPMDGRSCGFVPLWNALKHITRDCSTDEKAALFHRTAMRAYRLDVPGLA